MGVLVLVFAAVLFVASAWLWRSRSDLAGALAAAEGQTKLAENHKVIAQQKETEAKDALAKLTAEAASRQRAETEKTAVK